MTGARSIPNARCLRLDRHVACRLLLAVGVLAVFASNEFAAAQTFEVLHTFTFGADANSPAAGLTFDSAGNLYGTSTLGGAFNYGAVFKVDKSGKEMVVQSFDFNDGWWPTASLIRDSEGRFYGTAGGGSGGGKCGRGCGTVFSWDPSGKLKRLFTFPGGAGGWNPVYNVTRDALGNLYGTTNYGGVPGSCGGDTCGVVFKLGHAGKETVLYAFQGGKDGGIPSGGLIRDAAGNLYGTAAEGGDACSWDCGVVFQVDPNGHETVLYSFTGQADGGGPVGGLVRDEAGNFYGTAASGGDWSNCTIGCGTVFKLDPEGKETVMYTFHGDTDGAIPEAGVIRDASGNLYGTTHNNGNSYGVVFKLDTSGKETVLHAFTGGADGAQPMGKLVRDRRGNLYGVTENGGDPTCKCGVVFEISAAP
jgi:uncharacterized repeat protein (TIGR03803 family)